LNVFLFIKVLTNFLQDYWKFLTMIVLEEGCHQFSIMQIFLSRTK
jgi:hypothetical protein